MLTTFKTILSQKTQLTKDVFLFRFQLIEPKEISFKAGQYLILFVPQTDNNSVFERRLYSIASPDFEKDSFELLVQIVPGGVASTYLSNLKVGDQALFQGPAGMFILRESPRPKIFLATGTGLAPMRAMIKSEMKKLSNEVIKEKRKILNYSITQLLNYSLFWGLRHFSEVYLLDELKSYRLQVASFDFKICLSREQNLKMIPEEDKKYFALGHVDKVMEKEIKKLRNEEIIKKEKNLNYSITQLLNFFDFYLCGSRQVVESLRQFLAQKGVPANQVFFEKF